MTMIDLLGLFAGTLTTAAFVPQIVKIWRTRSTHDISLGMFSESVSAGRVTST